jgi:excinuclease ABC subunit C
MIKSLETLKTKSRELPREPGVYLMKNVKGTIIYVGKAKVLRHRVGSYFLGLETADVKTKQLVAEIHDFDAIVYNNELEALLAERTLIKHHRPKYNILLIDDKEYPFVRVQLNDPWPRFKKIRRLRDDGARYIGPFPNGHSLNIAMRFMHKVFPLIRCSEHEFKAAKRPCNYFHMKQCLGPCVLPVARDEYLKIVNRAADFLSGNNQKVIKELKQAMKFSSLAEDFENAATIRDQILALEKLDEKQSLISVDMPDADAIGVVRWGDEACIHVSIIRGASVVGGDNYYLLMPNAQDDVLSSFLLQFYDGRYVPARILLPSLPEEHHELRALLSKQKALQAGDQVSETKSPGEFGVEFCYRGDSDQIDGLLAIAEKNALYGLESRHAHKKNSQIEMEVLRDYLGLLRLPRVIECMDISNFQGDEVVASKVCFVDGKPAKERYRRYRIQSLTSGKPDDFQSMREAVSRRLARQEGNDEWPDLLVIDGGKGQLSAALGVLQELPDFTTSGIVLLALAKKKQKKKVLRFRDQDLQYQEERLFFPGEDQARVLIPGSVPYRILTSLRNEAHRFAITYHRKLRDKKSLTSELDEIPGVGKVLRERLLARFGDLDALRRADLEDVKSVSGVSQALAEEIKARLSKDD